MIQEKSATKQANGKTYVLRPMTPSDGADRTVVEADVLNRRVAGLHNISIDAIAANNFRQKIGKHGDAFRDSAGQNSSEISENQNHQHNGQEEA